MLSDVFKDLNTRLARLEDFQRTTGGLDISAIGAVHATTYAVNNQAITDGNTYTTGDLRGVNGVSVKALGIIGVLRGTSGGVNGALWVAGDSPDAFSSRLDCPTADLYSTLVLVKLSATGTLTVQADGQDFTGVYLSVVGWFK